METDAKFWYTNKEQAMKKVEWLKKQGFKNIRVKCEYTVTGKKS